MSPCPPPPLPSSLPQSTCWSEGESRQGSHAVFWGRPVPKAITGRLWRFLIFCPCPSILETGNGGRDKARRLWPAGCRYRRGDGRSAHEPERSTAVPSFFLHKQQPASPVSRIRAIELRATGHVRFFPHHIVDRRSHGHAVINIQCPSSAMVPTWTNRARHVKKPGIAAAGPPTRRHLASGQ